MSVLQLEINYIYHSNENDSCLYLNERFKCDNADIEPMWESGYKAF